MSTLSFSTSHPKQVLDITDEIQQWAGKQGKKDGLVHLFVMHTTCSVTTADLDPGTDLDMLDAIEKMIPKLHFRHPHDPAHAPDHIVSSIIGPSLLVPVKGGELVLGTWQRIVLVELSGPRTRNITVSMI
jgi:secondary thiamine-phosphate synthase enzyme